MRSNPRLASMLGSMLVLAALLAPASLGEGPGPRRPPPRTSSCSKPSVQCPMGTAPGCSITCIDPFQARCTPAGCLLGFPLPAQCFCSDC